MVELPPHVIGLAFGLLKGPVGDAGPPFAIAGVTTAFAAVKMTVFR